MPSDYRPDKSRFKNPSGAFLTKALFLEENYVEKSKVIYTLKDDDNTLHGILYPSLYKLYMELQDVTEYRFAGLYLFSWQHWKMLQECPWFIPYLSRWREELSLFLLQDQISKITALANAGNFQAHKYLIDKGWEQNTLPSQKKKKKELLPQMIPHDTLKEDFDRIFKQQTSLVSVN